MLRCPCELIKSFAFAKTNKSSVFPVNSFVKISLGCSCYHTKSVIFNIRQNQHFSKKEWGSRKYVFKEQKSFLWSSFLFWKDRKDKINLKEEAVNELDINNNNKIDPGNTKTSGNSTSNSNRYFKNSFTNDVNEIQKEELLEKNSKAVETSKKILEKSETESITRSSFTSDITHKKEKTSAEGISGVDNRTAKFVENNSQTTLEQDVDRFQKKDEQQDLLEIKRQHKELFLGEISNDITLEGEKTEKLTDEVPLLKDHSHKLIQKAKNILRKTTSALKTDENERNVKLVSLGEPKANLNLNATRRRQTVDLNRSSTERNFITPVRAMTDFLLKPSDLEGLRKTKRRSPYENDPPITVYWRKDVEAKIKLLLDVSNTALRKGLYDNMTRILYEDALRAIDVWGSKENLLKEILKRDIERRRYQQNLFTVKRRLRDYRREQGRESEIKLEQNGLFGPSGKVVLTAIGINGTNFMFKLVAWVYTGSHSMFSEAIHSLADTINQLILAYGIHKSVQRADSDHPYGYTNMRYVASLISGVGIFCVGSGLSLYHGVVGLTDPSDLPSFYWAFFILAGSLVSEGATLLVAFNSIRLGAKKSEMSFSEYVFRGQDPSVNVVLFEDLAAVMGVSVAGLCMGLSTYYNSHIPDAIGSFLVGGLLGGVASFIIYTNVAALVGRSIPQERLDKINAELESDVMIRAIHDVKGIDIGNSLVRYKAELDFDGGELTRCYLDKQDLNQLLEEVKKMQTIDELEEFLLRHGENIVDMMGGEIDRIELKLRKKHPEIRHCDLEIL